MIEPRERSTESTVDKLAEIAAPANITSPRRKSGGTSRQGWERSVPSHPDRAVQMAQRDPCARALIRRTGRERHQGYRRYAPCAPSRFERNRHYIVEVIKCRLCSRRAFSSVARARASVSGRALVGRSRALTHLLHCGFRSSCGPGHPRLCRGSTHQIRI